MNYVIKNKTNMKTIIKFTSIILLALSFTNCKKDKTEPAQPMPEQPSSGSISFDFETVVGDSSLVFSTKTYTNQAGNTFNITKLKYYISNIKLIKQDNSTWSESYSYHLIDHSLTNGGAFTITGVPFGTYTGVEFMIGVDSTHNVSGSQTGALDVTKDMFWDWNQGYIMAKFEGTSPQSTATGNKFMYHVGGFTGANKAIRIINPSFNGASANVTSSITPEIHIKNELLNWLNSPNQMDFSTVNVIMMPGANAKKVADNYASAFSVEHVHN